jgi:hypothetical protein
MGPCGVGAVIMGWIMGLGGKESRDKGGGYEFGLKGPLKVLRNSMYSGMQTF